MKPTGHAKRFVLAVVAGGVIGATMVVPAAATAADIAPAPPAQAALALNGTPAFSPLNLLPAPLACLPTTGFAVFCVGVTS